MSASSSLLAFLSNDYLLRQTTPYLLPHEIFQLAQCSRSFYHLLFHTKGVFRHVDISLSSIVPFSSAGAARPISLRRNYTDILSQQFIFRDTQTLILDGLLMNYDRLTALLIDPRCRISILSVRECPINQPMLMQTLHFLVRPGSKSTLKGVYIFTKTNGQPRAKNSWQRKGLGEIEFIEGWAETLAACQGKIVFDAVLCKGAKHMNMAYPPLEENTPNSTSAVADTPLSSSPMSTFSELSSMFGAHNIDQSSDASSSTASTSIGDEDDENILLSLLAAPPKLAMTKITRRCEICKSPAFPHSPILHAPVPLLTSSPALACKPSPTSQSQTLDELNTCYSCDDCCKDRLCEQCGKFWCESCYDITQGRICGIQRGGVLLDCYDCGRNCWECKKETTRVCKGCTSHYCAVHDEGTEKFCDWCSRSRRLTRELY